MKIIPLIKTLVVVRGICWFAWKPNSLCRSRLLVTVALIQTNGSSNKMLHKVLSIHLFSVALVLHGDTGSLESITGDYGQSASSSHGTITHTLKHCGQFKEKNNKCLWRIEPPNPGGVWQKC